jgi:transcriptional regulator with XRE-family HTH domain
MARSTPPPDDAPHRWAILRLREKIDASGKSVSEYAQTTGIPRAPNTLYRWLRGDTVIPRTVRVWLLDGFQVLDAAEESTPTKESENGPSQSQAPR